MRERYFCRDGVTVPLPRSTWRGNKLVKGKSVFNNGILYMKDERSGRLSAYIYISGLCY